MAFFLGVLYDLLTSGREAAQEIGGEVESKYNILGLGTVLLWTVYPVVWVLAEGLDKISVDQEVSLTLLRAMKNAMSPLPLCTHPQPSHPASRGTVAGKH